MIEYHGTVHIADSMVHLGEEGTCPLCSDPPPPQTNLCLALIGQMMCGVPDVAKPMIMRGEPWCCDDHRKIVLRQEQQDAVEDGRSH